VAKKVLIFSPFGNWPVHGQVDAVTGAALALRGAEVLAVTCNALYAPCSMGRGKYDCPSCFRTGSDLLTTFGIPQTTTNRWLTPDDMVRVGDDVARLTADDLTNLGEVKLGGLPVGAWVKPNLLTHFRITPSYLNEPKIQDTTRGFLKGAWLTHIALDRIIDDFPAETGLLFNARFFGPRAAFETMRRRDIDVVVHERGRIPASFSLRENSTPLSRDIETGTYRRWRDTPLTRVEIANVHALLHAKRSSKGTHVPSFYSERHGNSRIQDMLGIAEGQEIIGVFTSSQDEVSSVAGHEALTSQTQLLESLYLHYADKPVTVVVRHHPHVAGWHHGHRDNAFLEMLQAVEAKAPANFRTIAPGHDAISSYDLFPIISRAFAPFSTIANELMNEGIPTVVYRSLEGVAAGQVTLDGLDPASVRSAAVSLGERPPLLTREEMRKTLRCAYSFYFRTSVLLNSIGIKDFYKPDIKVKRPADLNAGKDPELDRLCDRLLGLGALYRTPADDPTPRTVAQENEALDEILRAAVVRRGQQVDAPLLGLVTPTARKDKMVTLRQFLEARTPVPFEDTIVLVNGENFAAQAGPPVSADGPFPSNARLLFYGSHTRSTDDLLTSVAFHRTLLQIRRKTGRYAMILGKGDYLLDETIEALLPPNLHRLWGNNLSAPGEKLRYFPMGRDFRSLAEIRATAPTPHKTMLCYVNYSLNTHPVRPMIFEAIKDKDFMLFEHMGNFLQYSKTRVDFMTRLAASKFAVCPRGNAIETFRMWDSLSLGAIPIVVKEAAFHDQLSDLPILFLDDAKDFGALTAAFLEETYQTFLDRPFNMEKLKLSYWLDRVYDDCLDMDAAKAAPAVAS